VSAPTLRVLSGGLAGLRTQLDSGGRRRSTPHPSGECSAAARPAGTDDGCNAEWDELLGLAEDAWHWRDPESLARVVRLVARLQCRIAEEWSD
jgi:hypothetical protein